jgi:hypothetical protein
VSLVAIAQIQDMVFTSENYGYFGEKLPSKIATFESDNEAEVVVKQIVTAVNLVQNFEIRVGGVANAAALIKDGKRYIVYDQYFMRNLTRQTGTKWAGISVMAHEVGHHLNGHTLDGKGSRPNSELEADLFSGGVLQKMGATLDDARKGIELLGTTTATETHPAKYDRLAAITKGWTQSCNNDTKCSQADNANTGRTRSTENSRPTGDTAARTHPGCAVVYEPYWIEDGRPGCRSSNAQQPIRSPTIPPGSGKIPYRQGDPNPCPYIGTIPIEWVNGSVRCGSAR